MYLSIAHAHCIHYDSNVILTCHQISYMISAWARMCKIFGTEFTQYLPLVMPSVMKAASIKPEVAVIDGLCQKYFSINFEISSTVTKYTNQGFFA